MSVFSFYDFIHSFIIIHMIFIIIKILDFFFFNFLFLSHCCPLGFNFSLLLILLIYSHLSFFSRVKSCFSSVRINNFSFWLLLLSLFLFDFFFLLWRLNRASIITWWGASFSLLFILLILFLIMICINYIFMNNISFKYFFFNITLLNAWVLQQFSQVTNQVFIPIYRINRDTSWTRLFIANLKSLFEIWSYFIPHCDLIISKIIYLIIIITWLMIIKIINLHVIPS